MKVKMTEGKKLLWFYFVKICTNIEDFSAPHFSRYVYSCRLIDFTTLKKLLYCRSKIPLQRTSCDLDF